MTFYYLLFGVQDLGLILFSKFLSANSNYSWLKLSLTLAIAIFPQSKILAESMPEEEVGKINLVTEIEFDDQNNSKNKENIDIS